MRALRSTFPAGITLCGCPMRIRFRGEHRPLKIAIAGHADAHKQLPLREAGALAAAATLQNLVDRLACGFILRTQLLGSVAAVLHRNCLSRVIALLACRYLEIPRVGNYDDFGVVAPKPLGELACRPSARIDYKLFSWRRRINHEPVPYRSSSGSR